jgi:hypothetical protein
MIKYDFFPQVANPDSDKNYIIIKPIKKAREAGFFGNNI